MPTFGYTTIGATTQGAYASNQYLGTEFTPDQDGTITRIWVYMEDTFDGSPHPFNVAVISSASSLPSTLLASGTESTYGVPFGWYAAFINYRVTANTPVFLSTWGNGSFSLKSDSGTTNQSFEKFLFTYPNWDTPDTGTNRNLMSIKFSIYAEFTPLNKIYVRTGIRPAMFKPGNAR